MECQLKVRLLACSRGVDLVRVEYIPDDKADISESVLKLKQRVGPDGSVFTSGGIGPTHDDVTYEAIAAAFGKVLCCMIDCPFPWHQCSTGPNYVSLLSCPAKPGCTWLMIKACKA